jgi:hypothetical protein
MKNTKKHHLIDLLFRCKDGKYVYFQFPNLPLMIAIFAYGLRLVISAEPYDDLLNIIFTAAIIFWSVLEIFWGVNLFRRLFGALILGFVLFGLIMS